MENQQTIVHKSRALSKHPWKYIDKPTIDLLWQCIPVAYSRSDYRKPLINLLDCYLGLTCQSITYLRLSNKSINKLFAGYIGALWCDSFVKASRATRDGYTRSFSRGLRAMADLVPSLTFEFDRETSLRVWRRLDIDPLQREYYEGWRIQFKRGELSKSLNLAWIWNTLGPESTRALHKTAVAFTERYEARSANNFVPVFNQFLEYTEREQVKIGEPELNDSAFTIELMEGFCRYFFSRNVDRKNCLQTTIKRWNDAVPFLDAVLLDSCVFARPYRTFPYIEPSRKTGAEHKLSVTDEGVLVKEKLIVDVPLELTDDEVIELLFEKINRDVDTVLTWANNEVSSIVARNRAGSGEFDYMDFGLEPSAIRMKYRKTKLRDARTRDIAIRLGLPTSYSLEPFVYLLIKEHPEITENFLLNLRLFDSRENLVGLESTDACTYLVGYKRRRGSHKAIQRIALSKTSIVLIEQVVELTKPLREYLRAKGDENYRYLFLNCRTGFCHPSRINNTLDPKKQTSAAKRRINQFRALMSQEGESCAEELAGRLTPSKFRATVGVQIYLETGSAKAMSKALGHAKYKPDLLSHYLPEPILAFFQARWVRIFQKGIICEAMKDSPMQFRASHFDSMDELDRFLNNHALSLPLNSNEYDQSNKSDVREAYISVDENILTVLLSLEAAVKEAGQKLISTKAVYWARFSSLLQSEIENITFDPELKSALQRARNNVDPALMRSVIYEPTQNIMCRGTTNVGR